MSTIESSNTTQPMQQEVDNGEDEVLDASEFHTRCFGCGCGFRRAVIIANAIMLTVRLLVVLLDGYYGLDDAVVLALAVPFIVFSHGFGIFGALHFHRCAIITTAVLYSATIALDIVFMILHKSIYPIANLLISALCLYPHVCFLHLLDKGIIGKEETQEFVPQQKDGENEIV